MVATFDTEDKEMAQLAHAQNRAMERYGINFNKHVRFSMQEIIRKANPSDCLLFEKQSHRVSVYLLQWQGEWIKVSYDWQRKSISSFLPIEIADFDKATKVVKKKRFSDIEFAKYGRQFPQA